MASVPPRSSAASAGGTSVPTGANRMAASSGSGGGVVRVPGAGAPSSSASSLCLGRAGHDVDAGAAGQRDLRREVRRAAEPVDAEAAALGEVGPLQGAVADDAGAEQRRDLDVVERLGERVGVGLVDHGVLGVAPVDVPAGEARVEAEVLASRSMQKRQTPQVWASQGTPMRSPTCQRVLPVPSCVDDADHLVARRDDADGVAPGRPRPGGGPSGTRRTRARARGPVRAPARAPSLSTCTSGPPSIGPGRSTAHAFISAGIGVSVGRDGPAANGP